MENKIKIREKTDSKIVYIELIKKPDWDTFYNKFLELACNLNDTWKKNSVFINTLIIVPHLSKIDRMKNIYYDMFNKTEEEIVTSIELIIKYWLFQLNENNQEIFWDLWESLSFKRNSYYVDMNDDFIAEPDFQNHSIYTNKLIKELFQFIKTYEKENEKSIPLWSVPVGIGENTQTIMTELSKVFGEKDHIVKNFNSVEDIKRLEKILIFNPIKGYIGLKKWKGYLIYEFKNLDVVICESIFTGNATYILKGNWGAMIVHGRNGIRRNFICGKDYWRFYHCDNWYESVKNVMFNEKNKIQK